MNRTAMLPLCLLALWLTACGTAESAAPAAAPTACTATNIAPDTPINPAVSNWNCANIRLETVFEPAINAPNAPTAGAKNG